MYYFENTYIVAFSSLHLIILLYLYLNTNIYTDISVETSGVVLKLLIRYQYQVE